MRGRVYVFALFFINFSTIYKHERIDESWLVLRFEQINLANEYGSIKLFSNSSLKSRSNLSMVWSVLTRTYTWILFSCTLNIRGRSFSAAKNIWDCYWWFRYRALLFFSNFDLNLAGSTDSIKFSSSRCGSNESIREMVSMIKGNWST